MCSCSDCEYLACGGANYAQFNACDAAVSYEDVSSIVVNWAPGNAFSVWSQWIGERR